MYIVHCTVLVACRGRGFGRHLEPLFEVNPTSHLYKSVYDTNTTNLEDGLSCLNRLSSEPDQGHPRSSPRNDVKGPSSLIEKKDMWFDTVF